MVVRNKVSPEEAERVRRDARIYAYNGLIERIVRSALPADYLFDLATRTVYSMGTIAIYDPEAKVKIKQKSTSKNLRNALKGCAWDASKYGEKRESLDEVFPIISEELVVGLERPVSDHFNLDSTKEMDFRREIIGELNRRLKPQIEEAEKSSLGYLFCDILPRLAVADVKETDKMCWAYLVSEDPVKNLMRPLLDFFLHLKLYSDAVANLPVGEEVEIEVVKLMTKKVKRLERAGECLVTTELDSGNHEETVYLNEMLDPIYLLEGMLDLVQANLDRVKDYKTDFDLTEALGELTDTLASEIVDERKSRKTSESSLESSRKEFEISKKRIVELNTKLAEEARDRERMLAEREKELENKKGEVDQLKKDTSAKEVKRLKGELESKRSITSRLAEENKLLREESQEAWRETETLERRLASLRPVAQREPFYTLVDMLDGTKWADTAEEVVAAIYGGSKSGIFSGTRERARLSLESLEQNTRRKLPKNRQAKVNEVIREMLKEDVYVEAKGGGVSLNAHIDEISDESLREVVDEVYRMRRDSKG